MKIIQFNLEEFNPDCMCPDEIRQWLAFIGPGFRPQVANQWFPGVKGRYRHARDVRNYLWNKLVAMELRLEGNIEAAQGYERICDRIYATLPKSAKW
jgi:hypothetical protein